MGHDLIGVRRGMLLGALSLLALTGCAEPDPEHGFLAAENPYYYCRRQGVAPDGTAFEGCLAAVVAARCADADAEAQAHCERHLSEMIRATDALKRRG